MVEWKPPSTGTPVQVVPGAAAPVASGIPAVRDMKATMQALADAIARDTGAATMPAHPAKADPGIASSDVSKSKQAFNNFVLELHSGSLSPEEQYDVNEVMKTLQSLKSGSKDFRISGAWDTANPNDITTQSLRDIVLFIGGLLNLENAGFAGKQTYYTKEQWQQLKKFVDMVLSGMAAKATTEQKEVWAKNIITHLKSMLKLYNYYFRDQFLRHEYLRPLIEGHAAFENYDIPLSEAERQMVEEGATISFNVPGISKGPMVFPLRVLLNPTNFSTYLQRLGFEGDPSKVLLSIKKQLGMVQ